MNWTRRQLLASGMAAGLTACSGGAPRNKAGGPPPPVTVTLGTPDARGVLPDTQDITYFARQVHQLSGGQMNIRILWLVTQADNFEQATAALVKDGRVDLGWIGARAWDTLGVRSFQALQAPFLIDSYPLLHAVLRSPMASHMLAGLNQAGFTGPGAVPRPAPPSGRVQEALRVAAGLPRRQDPGPGLAGLRRAVPRPGRRARASGQHDLRPGRRQRFGGRRRRIRRVRGDSSAGSS